MEKKYKKYKKYSYPAILNQLNIDTTTISYADSKAEAIEGYIKTMNYIERNFKSLTDPGWRMLYNMLMFESMIIGVTEHVYDRDGYKLETNRIRVSEIRNKEEKISNNNGAAN